MDIKAFELSLEKYSAEDLVGKLREHGLDAHFVDTEEEAGFKYHYDEMTSECLKSAMSSDEKFADYENKYNFNCPPETEQQETIASAPLIAA